MLRQKLCKAVLNFVLRDFFIKLVCNVEMHCKTCKSFVYYVFKIITKPAIEKKKNECHM